MKKRTLCLLLAMAMILGLFAACGSQPAPASAESAAESVLSAAASEAAPAEAAEEEAEAPAEEVSEEVVSAEEPSAVEPAFEEVTYELPLVDEPVTFSMFCSTSPTASNISKADNLVWKELQARTGVNFDLTEVDTWSYTEKFMLMVAGGDWTDVLVNVRTTYTGGLAAALNEDVILDLNDYADCFPNYYNLINSDLKVNRDTTLGDGEIGAFYGVFEEPRPLEAGLFMRGDWLDALGIEAPDTVDEYYEALKAMNSEYGGVMHLPKNGVLSDQAILSAWDITGFFINAGFFVSLQPFVAKEDNQLICGFQQDGFREYLKTMNKWYSEKLIDPDFISSTSASNYLSDGSDELSGLLNDKYSLWGDSVDYLPKYAAAMDPNFEARPIPLPTLNEGDTVKCGENLSRVDMDYYSLSAVCKDPELLCKFFDYSYTEEGYMLQNWGIEGETYVTNPDGTHSYTDLIIEHPGYDTVLEARAALLGGNATIRTMEAYHAMHNDAQMNCYDVWNSNFTAEYAVPGQLPKTDEESQELTGFEADLVTHLEQNVAQFIVGTRDPYDDAEWDAFQNELKSLNIERYTEINQQIYDRYIGMAS